MNIELAAPGAGARCEAILRSLPAWFGIESAVRQYVADTETDPTFTARVGDAVLGFITLRQHFEQAFELHCLAVHASARHQGYGRALVEAAEAWARARGALFIQVKTLAASHPSAEYAETRAFYLKAGYVPLEEFPTLWSSDNPCLQLVKALQSRT